MKNICLLIVAIFMNFVLFANGNYSYKTDLGDSILQQRFIKSVLKEYEMEGRWIFSRVDSLYKLRNNYEIINPINIYNSLSEGFTSFDNRMFIFITYPLLIDEKVLQRNGEYKTQIKGIKVNMRRYKTMLKQSKEKILLIYFNADKILKKQYKKWLYELIAVCYTNNVKVITPSNRQPYYEVFK